MKKIWLYDNVIIGNNHIAVNSGMLHIATHLTGDQNEVKMFGDPSHLTILKSRLSSQLPDEAFRPIKVIAPSASNPLTKILSWKKKLRTDYNEFKKMVEQAILEQVDVIIITTLFPANYPPFFNLIRKYPEILFCTVLHGEVEYIFRKDVGLMNRLKAERFVKAFRKIPGNLRLLAFNNYTRQQLLDGGYIKNTVNIISINHPLSCYDYSSRLVGDDRGEINVVHLGIANKRKGSASIFDLYEELKDVNNIKLSVIGRVDTELKDKIRPGVFIASENSVPIEQDKYESYIRKAHYSLSFIQGNEYLFRTSGSLLDSLIYQLPVIALEHPAVRELFEMEGNIGFICKDMQELKTCLRRIGQGDVTLLDQYKEQVGNLKKLCARFSPADIASYLYPLLKYEGHRFGEKRH